MDSLSKFFRLYRCIRHIPPKQLARRAWLNIKRRALLTPLGVIGRRCSKLQFEVSGELPNRLMQLRAGLVSNQLGNYSLMQLGNQYSLRPPIDWQLEKVPGHTHLQRLAMHYHEFLEVLPPQVARDAIFDWIDHNPLWRCGYWLDSWNCYAISIRCVCWMRYFHEHQHILSELQINKLLLSLAQQVHFLSCNLETDICGNHLIKNIRCLLWAGVFFKGPHASRWHSLGQRLLVAQLPIQILPDGMHFELSPAYHCQVFADLLECAQTLAGDSRKRILDKLTASAQAIADLTHPDGYISLFSDGGLSMAFLPNECLKAWKQLEGQPVTSLRSVRYDIAGFYGARFGESYFLADCGPVCADALPAHGHADVLSFEWDVGEQRVIVDAGVGEYEAGQRRYWGRSTAAHNTVTVCDTNQAELIGSFRTGRRSLAQVEEFTSEVDRLHLIGSCRYRIDSGTVDHRREFNVTECSVKVSDFVGGSARGEVVSRLLLHHDCKLRFADDFNAEIVIGGITIELSCSNKMRTRDACWSSEFGQSINTTQIEMLGGSSPCKLGFELRVVERC